MDDFESGGNDKKRRLITPGEDTECPPQRKLGYLASGGQIGWVARLLLDGVGSALDCDHRIAANQFAKASHFIGQNAVQSELAQRKKQNPLQAPRLQRVRGS